MKNKLDFSPVETNDYCANVGKRWFRPWSKSHMDALASAEKHNASKGLRRQFVVMINPHVSMLGGLGWQQWSNAFDSRKAAKDCISLNWPVIPKGFKVKIEVR